MKNPYKKIVHIFPRNIEAAIQQFLKSNEIKSERHGEIGSFRCTCKEF